MTAHIKHMTVEDIPSALAVLEESLGEGFISPEELVSYTVQREKRSFIACAEDTGRIVAVATGVLPPDSMSLLSMIPEDQQSKVEELVPELTQTGHRVGLLKSVAVGPSARGMGLGTKVSSAVVQSLVEDCATRVMSIGWTDEDGCHIQKPLESLGFNSRGDLPDFWQQDSILHGYSCPTCGHPCECTARIFLL